MIFKSQTYLPMYEVLSAIKKNEIKVNIEGIDID